jgi:hypothetical protein
MTYLCDRNYTLNVVIESDLNQPPQTRKRAFLCTPAKKCIGVEESGKYGTEGEGGYQESDHFESENYTDGVHPNVAYCVMSQGPF